MTSAFVGPVEVGADVTATAVVALVARVMRMFWAFEVSFSGDVTDELMLMLLLLFSVWLSLSSSFCRLL